MRFRAGVVLCLLLAYAAVGCRTALTPNIDRNIAPETWITAAPFDTITLVKGRDPEPVTIPVRFHVYWAGADQDGAVSGYYWAVTETLPTPPEGFLDPPSLPGPKPQDYRYTSRTDSIFIFNVAEGIPDRQHAFFIYAVDNLGKPDPTPARFIFFAADNYPPIPIFLQSEGCGDVYRFEGSTLLKERVCYPIKDQDAIGRAPRDTVPANSTLTFRWTATVAFPEVAVSGYRYKLDEPGFVPVPATVTSLQYNSGVGGDTVRVAPGTKVFVLRAVDQAGGTRDSTRRFQLNFSPDGWFSGPDSSWAGWRVKPNGERYVLWDDLRPGGSLAGGLPNSLLGPDSVQVLPAFRPERRTFLEFWNDTIYCRAEYDTVHLNSYAIFHSGGFDRDSPYIVRVTDLARSLPGFPGGPVLTSDPRSQPNGSAIGFRLRLVVEQTPDGSTYLPPQSGVYPLFDPNDPFNLPRIGSYNPNFTAGRAYALTRAEDGDGARDQRIEDPREFVLRYDANTLDPDLRPLRGKVMVFYINQTPYLDTTEPQFQPLPGHVFTDLNWHLVLPGVDPDPYQFGTPRGNSSSLELLRRRIWVEGKNPLGEDVRYTDGIPYQNTDDINFVVPGPLLPGPCTLVVELCDCFTCETTPGQGSCTTVRIPVVYAPPAPGATTSSLDRPGTR